MLHAWMCMWDIGPCWTPVRCSHKLKCDCSKPSFLTVKIHKEHTLIVWTSLADALSSAQDLGGLKKSKICTTHMCLSYLDAVWFEPFQLSFWEECSDLHSLSSFLTGWGLGERDREADHCLSFRALSAQWLSVFEPNCCHLPTFSAQARSTVCLKLLCGVSDTGSQQSMDRWGGMVGVFINDSPANSSTN